MSEFLVSVYMSTEMEFKNPNGHVPKMRNIRNGLYYKTASLQQSLAYRIGLRLYKTHYLNSFLLLYHAILDTA